MIELLRAARRHWADLLVALILALGAGFASLHESARISPSLFSNYADDVWFEGDVARSLANFTDRHSNHYRTEVHPISSLILNPFVVTLGKVWRGSPLELARHAMAVLAGLWALLLFTLLRLRSSGVAHATCFSLLGIAGAAFVFWFSVPETYGAGSITLIVVLIGAAIADRRGGALRGRWLIALGAVSLSITVTNWMAGIALAIKTRPWRGALAICAATLAIVFCLALVQKFYYPSSRIFLWGAGGEGEYITQGLKSTPLDRIRVLYLESFAAPRASVLPASPPYHHGLSMQHPARLTATGAGIAALLLWMLLLIAGLWACVAQVRARRTFAAVLLMLIAGQTALHLVYGPETFLYVLHPFPCLVVLCAESRRWAGASITGGLALFAAGCAFANNQSAFGFAVEQVASSMNERDKVLQERSLHPERPWPRGDGHVVLALPGTPLDEKAYHEPGGSVSPAPNTFGVSLWIVSADGKRIQSSETMPMRELEQRFDGAASDFEPSILTRTPYFDVRWHKGPGSRLEGRINAKSLPAGAALWLVTRSVGPAGGEVARIDAQGNHAETNGAWRLTIDAAPQGWVGGDESRTELALTAPSADLTARSAEGWSFVAAKLDTSHGANDVAIERASPAAARGAGAPGSDATAQAAWSAQPLWSPHVPDPQFAAAAHATQMHLLMGLTDHETRPGEPLNYDSEWSRDASIIAATLAHAGQTRIAQALSRNLATRDFAGGFGAEGDAPGLTLWALDEVSSSLADPSFDRTVLADARRKVDWIERCLNARGPVTSNEAKARPTEPDATLVCARARLGLAVGRMDGHFPILYINAVDYAGLSAAARIAERAGDSALADRARRLAAPLPERWARLDADTRKARALALYKEYARQPALLAHDFLRGKADRDRNVMIVDNVLHANGDDRTYISALWPTWIAAASRTGSSTLLNGLEARWSPRRFDLANTRHRPWTYFDFAEAHQWLLLGRPDRAWQVLRWYFAQDISPGLYAWWEGTGEENSSDQWANTRGWIEPHGVSPHYWSAAEALALEMDALAYADASTTQPTVVIGAGVPTEWVHGDSDLDSDWISTRVGRVRWRLTGNTVRVACECVQNTAIALRGGLAGLAVRPVAAASLSE